MEVTLKDKTRQTGLLKAAEETHITLESTQILREGKKKIETLVQTPIPFEQIEKTVVKLAF